MTLEQLCEAIEVVKKNKGKAWKKVEVFVTPENFPLDSVKDYRYKIKEVSIDVDTENPDGNKFKNIVYISI